MLLLAGFGDNSDAFFRLVGIDEAYRDQGGIDVRIGDPQILRQPNGTQPLSSWLSQAVYSLVLRGNVFGLVLSRNNMALPTRNQGKERRGGQGARGRGKGQAGRPQ